jgi:choline dehydrogenase-like flavoprotein
MATIPTYDVLVIGSGFGGTMTAMTIARAFLAHHREEPTRQKRVVHMLERGTWWTTPVGTVQDPEIKTADLLREKGQPVQYWSAATGIKGVLDIFLRCVRRKGNEDGLYDPTYFGTKGFLGFGAKNDGVSILRANGVGGGSLVYSNVTIRPPDFVLDDPRWPAWPKAERDEDFEFARDAIGRGVLWAFASREGKIPKAELRAPNAGLSRIVTRSARIDPEFFLVADPTEPNRQDARVDRSNHRLTTGGPLADTKRRLWVDRSRVFQQAVSGLTDDYGTVDLSINDLRPEHNPPMLSALPAPPTGPPNTPQWDRQNPPNPLSEPPYGNPTRQVNYCERQARCNVGCLPGARHTLNKQLMAAIHGTPNEPEPALEGHLTLQPLTEVDEIRARPDGGYDVHVRVRDPNNVKRFTREVLTARDVIVAAGCVGSTELLLRSKASGGLAGLSSELGKGFSTNGDYLAFLEKTDLTVRLTRGPVTSSYAHFDTPWADPGKPDDGATFHTVEDQGVPPAFASIVGTGSKLMRHIANARGPRFTVLLMLIWWFFRRVFSYIAAFFVHHRTRRPEFDADDEATQRMMCIAAMGREASIGVFSLGGRGETPLRVKRADGREFHEDPIYDRIRGSLTRLARRLTSDSSLDFVNPFLTPTADALRAKSITLSHPLGGCRMAMDATKGVVDPSGRVFDTSKGPSGTYRGLYVADAAVIPTALGVNPSLTITALAIRFARAYVQQMEEP